MKRLEAFNKALDDGLTKAIFDHLRNYLMCTFLLAIGSYALKQHSGMFLGTVPLKTTGVGIIALSVTLILLNLYDGILKLSRKQYPKFFTYLLVILYIFVSLRIIEMAWDFRTDL